MLLVPGHLSGERFDQEFFRREFKDGDTPKCELILEDEDISVVELVLLNGSVLDINCFEEFRRGYLVANVFVNPPKCDRLYRAYVRYDSIFQVNVRRYRADSRPVGFAQHTPTVEVLESVRGETESDPAAKKDA